MGKRRESWGEREGRQRDCVEIAAGGVREEEREGGRESGGER